MGARPYPDRTRTGSSAEAGFWKPPRRLGLNGKTGGWAGAPWGLRGSGVGHWGSRLRGAGAGAARPQRQLLRTERAVGRCGRSAASNAPDGLLHSARACGGPDADVCEHHRLWACPPGIPFHVRWWGQRSHPTHHPTRRLPEGPRQQGRAPGRGRTRQGASEACAAGEMTCVEWELNAVDGPPTPETTGGDTAQCGVAPGRSHGCWLGHALTPE